MSEREDLTFTSGGETCAAWLYRPEGAAGPAPCVVMAHGFSATREDRLPAYAERFAAAGMACCCSTTATSATPRATRANCWTSAASRPTTAPPSPSRGRWRDRRAPDRALRDVVLGRPRGRRGGRGSVDRGGRLAGPVRRRADRPGRHAAADRAARHRARPRRPGRRAGRARPAPHARGRPARVVRGHDQARRPAGLRGDRARRLALAQRGGGAGHAAHRALPAGALGASVACPLLVCVCDGDTTPAGGGREDGRARAARRGDPLPIGHFEIYVGENFERAVADQTAFLQRHLAPWPRPPPWIGDFDGRAIPDRGSWCWGSLIRLVAGCAGQPLGCSRSVRRGLAPGRSGGGPRAGPSRASPKRRPPAVGAARRRAHLALPFDAATRDRLPDQLGRIRARLN